MDDPNSAEGFVSDFLEDADAGAMVTRFLLVVEGIDSDGERAIYMRTHEGAAVWDVMGLAQFALSTEQVGLIRRQMNGD